MTVFVPMVPRSGEKPPRYDLFVIPANAGTQEMSACRATRMSSISPLLQKKENGIPKNTGLPSLVPVPLVCLTLR